MCTLFKTLDLENPTCTLFSGAHGTQVSPCGLIKEMPTTAPAPFQDVCTYVYLVANKSYGNKNKKRFLTWVFSDFRSECTKPEQLVVTFAAGYIGKQVTF